MGESHPAGAIVLKSCRCSPPVGAQIGEHDGTPEWSCSPLTLCSHAMPRAAKPTWKPASKGAWEMQSAGSASQDTEQDREGLGQDQGIGGGTWETAHLPEATLLTRCKAWSECLTGPGRSHEDRRGLS